MQHLKGALRSAFAGLRKTRARRGPNADSCEHSSGLPAARSADDFGGGGTGATLVDAVSVPSLVGDSPELETLRREKTRLTARVDELELELAFAQARTTAAQRDDLEQRVAGGAIPPAGLLTIVRALARAHADAECGPQHWS